MRRLHGSYSGNMPDLTLLTDYPAVSLNLFNKLSTVK